MATPLNKEQADKLEGIKKTLTGISDTLGKLPDSEKARIENTNLGKGISNVLTGATNVFANLKTENGVLTSRTAQNAVDSAGKVINSKGSGSNPLAELMNANTKLQAEFAKEKATRAKLEADLSIKNQLGTGETGTTTGTTTGKPVDPTKNTTTTATTGTTVQPVEEVIPGLENDPTANAIMQAFNERVAVTNANVDRLNDFVEASDDDTASAIKSLQATARGQIKRVEAENIRIAQAARVAGIVSGRGMYSPEEHEGIISEVISEGIDRVTDIENTRDTAILEAKKAQREFNYKAYVEMSDLVTELSDLKREAIIDMKDRLREIETDARDKMKFDQEQADRNAFILAPELMDATSDEIYKAALANGIDPGLLSREVQTYKDERTMNDLDIQSKRESILSSQASRQLDQARFDREGKTEVEEEDALTPDELKKFSEEYGIRTGKGETATNLIPTYWTRSDLDGFINKYPNAPAEDLPKLIKQYEDVTIASSITDETERNNYLASVVEPTDVVVREVTNKIQNDFDSFFRQAKQSGDASFWKGKESDVKVWVSKPTTQAEIAALADSGLTSYQIFNELKRLYGDK